MTHNSNNFALGGQAESLYQIHTKGNDNGGFNVKKKTGYSPIGMQFRSRIPVGGYFSTSMDKLLFCDTKFRVVWIFTFSYGFGGVECLDTKKKIPLFTTSGQYLEDESAYIRVMEFPGGLDRK